MLQKILGAVLVLTLCAALAPAQMQPMSYRMTGNLPSVHMSVSGLDRYAYGDICPVVDASGATIYIATWYVCVYTTGPSVFENTCSYVYGTAPASAIKSQGSRLVVLDLDIPMLTNAYVSGWQCSSYYCGPFTPTSVPFKGNFTSNIGAPGSYSNTDNGRSDQTNFWYGGTYKYSFNGSRTGTSAVFVGQIGPAAFTAPQMGGNASMNVQKGILEVSQTLVPVQ